MDTAGGYGIAATRPGRGGQSVKVRPDMNVIVVTTGGGFDYDTELNQHLLGAVVDLEKPLPANPEGSSGADGDVGGAGGASTSGYSTSGPAPAGDGARNYRESGMGSSRMPPIWKA